MAMARPPSVIVFKLNPKRSSTTTPASSDNGMAVQEIAAVRKFIKNNINTATTSTAPSRSDERTLPVAV